MPKAVLRTALICCSIFAAVAAPKFVWAGGSAPEDAEPEEGVAAAADPALDAHERRARAFAAALARSRALQREAVLTGMPAARTEGAPSSKIWMQSQVVANRWRLALPVNGEVRRGYDRRVRHYGVDIKVDMNAPIFAVAAGVVVRAGWDDTGYGRMVWIDHGGGLRTLYAHMNAMLVERGQLVQQGQQLGYAGSSGHSTGPHLHFEVKQDKVKLDPLAFYPDGRAPVDPDLDFARNRDNGLVIVESSSRAEEKRQ